MADDSRKTRQPTTTTKNPPLAWREARFRLRAFLEAYAADTPPTPVVQREGTMAMPTTTSSFVTKISWLWTYDLDMYVGSLGSAIAIISLVSIMKSRNGLREDTFETGYFELQFNTGIILSLGCLINLWLVQRRRRSNHKGSETFKKREIAAFLKEIEQQEAERLSQQDTSSGDADIQERPLELDGTALAGVYPVYRRRFRHGEECHSGSWCRVPTLLLVQGDYIALQIGDVAPAACQLIDCEGDSVPSVHLKSGEIITLETFQETSNLTAGKWPRGRTTLPKDSDRLLTLCNNMKIFEMTETPLEAFLKQPQGMYLPWCRRD